jgi:predicted transcriptional regulator
MKRTPCEYIVWNLLPAIRSEIARSMINDFGLNQKKAAEKLRITPAAVCLYLSDKRATVKISDKKILKKIQESTENIIKDKNTDLIIEICKICKTIKSKDMFLFSDSKTNNKMGNLILCNF